MLSPLPSQSSHPSASISDPSASHTPFHGSLSLLKKGLIPVDGDDVNKKLEESYADSLKVLAGDPKKKEESQKGQESKKTG